MKRELLSLAVLATLLLVPATGRAQSIKDLFNKDNISKVVNAVTGHTETVDMTGTWRYREGGKCRDRQVNSGYDRHLVVYRLRH